MQKESNEIQSRTASRWRMATTKRAIHTRKHSARCLLKLRKSEARRATEAVRFAGPRMLTRVDRSPTQKRVHVRRPNAKLL